MENQRILQNIFSLSIPVEFCRFRSMLYFYVHNIYFFLEYSGCSIAECFAFLVCTKWSNPAIHRNIQTRERCSSSSVVRYLDWNSGLIVYPEQDQHQNRICGLQDIGGHIMKIPIIVFQILLCMYLEVCCTFNSDLLCTFIFNFRLFTS